MIDYMSEAIKEAKKAYKKGEVPIGAVIVKDGRIIARAHNLREIKQNTLAHAEVLCIDKACKRLNSWRLDGAQMYVTLEPCAMCAGAISQARIKKVFFGAFDDKNGCVGSKANILELDLTHKCEYELVESHPECSEIIKKFFKELRSVKSKE